MASARAAVKKFESERPEWLPAEALVKEVVDEAVGLGPLEDFLADDTVDEIMVNGWARVYVERHGRIELTDKQFTGNEQVLAVIRRILSPIGRRIDESSPMVDGRLADGSRVNAIIAPLSLTGPTITIRKFARTPYTHLDLIRFGSISPPMAEFLKFSVVNRRNIVISGGTGSGKTTLLNILSGFIPATERIVTIEDAAELQLAQEHVVSLESKPASIEGKGEIPIRKLVINALRMRPDRIVVGECRGGEALDMLQAMNTGHDGSLTTLHANSPRDVLARLETMVLMAGLELPSRAIREQIVAAISLIVHGARLPDGSRKITNVSEITGMEGDTIVLQPVFEFKQKGFDEHGKVLGDFRPSGAVPTFVPELRERGIPVDMSLFKSDEEPS
jgi:pilus assembly protein CpaF